MKKGKEPLRTFGDLKQFIQIQTNEGEAPEGQSATGNVEANQREREQTELIVQGGTPAPAGVDSASAAVASPPATGAGAAMDIGGTNVEQAAQVATTDHAAAPEVGAVASSVESESAPLAEVTHDE